MKRPDSKLPPLRLARSEERGGSVTTSSERWTVLPGAPMAAVVFAVKKKKEASLNKRHEIKERLRKGSAAKLSLLMSSLAVEADEMVPQEEARRVLTEASKGALTMAQFSEIWDTCEVDENECITQEQLV